MYIATLLILTYVKSTSCEMLDWMKLKHESSLPGEIISNFRYADDTTLMAESKQELKSLLMKVKVQNEKAGLNNSAFKKPDHGIRPHHFMANRWGKMKTLTDLIFRVP